MHIKKEKALVLLSGGQDSTTCLFWAKKHFNEVFAICFRYGQKHELETEIAQRIAEKYNVPFKLMDASFIAGLSKNALTDNSVAMDSEKWEGKVPNTFVPCRNIFFLSLAAVYAYNLNIHHLVTGVSQTDFSGYPDCRDSFIKSMNISLNLGMDESFVIHTPLMWINKAETWQLADELGVLEVIQKETLTCYNGIPADGCGRCPACKLRKNGFKEYLNTQKETIKRTWKI